METYNYFTAVKADLELAISERDLSKYIIPETDLTERERAFYNSDLYPCDLIDVAALTQDLIYNDMVTGLPSESYTCNTYEAVQYLERSGLFTPWITDQARYIFEFLGVPMLFNSPEYIDVILRCYYVIDILNRNLLFPQYQVYQGDLDCLGSPCAWLAALCSDLQAFARRVRSDID